jgi:hypothetical protein
VRDKPAATFFVCFLLFLTLVGTRGAFAARLHFLAKISRSRNKILATPRIRTYLGRPIFILLGLYSGTFSRRRGGGRGVF